MLSAFTINYFFGLDLVIYSIRNDQEKVSLTLLVRVLKEGKI